MGGPILLLRRADSFPDYFAGEIFAEYKSNEDPLANSDKIAVSSGLSLDPIDQARVGYEWHWGLWCNGLRRS